MSKYTDMLRNAVKSRLLSQDISQNELGGRIGASSAEMSNWLSGKTAIRFDKVCEIAAAFGDEPWQLLRPAHAPENTGDMETREKAKNSGHSAVIGQMTPQKAADHHHSKVGNKSGNLLEGHIPSSDSKSADLSRPSLVLIPGGIDPRREILVILATLHEDQLPAFAALARGLLTPSQAEDVADRLKGN